MPFTRLHDQGPGGNATFLYTEKGRWFGGQRFHLRISPAMAGPLADSLDAIMLGAVHGEPRKPNMLTRLRLDRRRPSRDWRLFHSEPVTNDPREILWIEGEYPISPKARAVLTFADKHYCETEGGHVLWSELDDLVTQLRQMETESRS